MVLSGCNRVFGTDWNWYLNAVKSHMKKPSNSTSWYLNLLILSFHNNFSFLLIISIPTVVFENQLQFLMFDVYIFRYWLSCIDRVRQRERWVFGLIRERERKNREGEEQDENISP